MKMQNILQGTIAVLLGGILLMLIALYRKVPSINILTQGQLRRISEIEDDDTRKAMRDSQSVFLINGDVDANVYNVVTVQAEDSE